MIKFIFYLFNIINQRYLKICLKDALCKTIKNAFIYGFKKEELEAIETNSKNISF